MRNRTGLDEMIAGSAIAAVICDPSLPDNPIVSCNDAFVALTGYALTEIIGRNCRFLTGLDTDPTHTGAIRTSICDRRPAIVEILNYRKSGVPFRNAVMIVPIFGAGGELEYFLGSQMEVVIDTPNAGTSRAQRARAQIDGLSPRQRQVAFAMAEGKLNKQIAHELGLAERTIKMHRAALLKALEVRTAAEAMRLLIEAGY